MTVTYRRPLRIVTANAAPIPRVLAVRTSRGWNQTLARADITVPYPPPANVGKGSKIKISGGVNSAPVRFSGFVTGYGAELWPSTWTFPVEDNLWLAKEYKASTNYDLSNMTDEDAVTFILLQMGMFFQPDLILGTGKKVSSTASQAATWTRGTTALSKILEIDAASVVDHGDGVITAFRTWCDFGGNIRRTEIANLPEETAARSFVEGVDLETGNASVEPIEPHTSVTALGDGVSSTVDDGGENSWAVLSNPASYLYPMLQQASGDPDALSTALVAAYMLQKSNFNLVRISFKTWRDDLIGALETDFFDSDHCRFTLNAFVESVVTNWLESGEFSQEVSLVSVRELNTNTASVGGGLAGMPNQFDPFTGALLPAPATIVPVPPSTLLASFLVEYISAELVIIDDAETIIYTAVCKDTSTSSGGTIATRSWTTTGGATPSTGSSDAFNPSWTDLATASVTLTVTDSLANSSSITRAISTSMGVPVRTRDLFAAATDALEAFSGADKTWRKYTTGIATATVVANGPLWAQGDTVYRSSDYLATAPSTSVPSSGVAVTSIWTELDLSANAVAVGLADGSIALSSDQGATWTVKVGPDPPNEVLKVILSRFNAGQIQAITASGYYVSNDTGDSWQLLRAGDYRDLDLNPFRSWAIEVSGGSGAMIEAATGTAITGATDDLVCTTSHIDSDRGYALAADGSAYLLATDGATVLTAGTAIPTGTPQHRGCYRDGTAADIYYAAAGTGGVVKTTDGGRATWWLLRKPSVGNAGAGPWPMIGAGALAVPAAIVSGIRIYVFGVAPNALYKSTDGGATYSAVTGHGLGGLVAYDVLGGASGADIIVVSGGTSMAMSTDGGSTWNNLTALPTSVAQISIVSASVIFASGTGPTIYKSTDGGATWPTWSTSGDSTNIWATSGAVWVSTTTQSVKRRYDHAHGSLVTINHAAAGNLTPLHAATDDICFLAKGESSGVNKVLKLDGAAASFTDITPAGAITGRWFDAYTVDGTVIVALIHDYDDAGAAVGQLWRSADGGSSWTKVAEDVQLQPSGGDVSTIGYLAATGTTWACAGGDSNDGSADSVVWYSTDNGATWASATVASGQTDLGPIRVVAG